LSSFDDDDEESALGLFTSDARTSLGHTWMGLAWMIGATEVPATVVVVVVAAAAAAAAAAAVTVTPVAGIGCVPFP
jgi:hypothetical protein